LRTRLTGLGVHSEFGIQNSEFISQDLLGNQTLSRTLWVIRDGPSILASSGPIGEIGQLTRRKFYRWNVAYYPY
jgi:hypothetical protein